MIAGGVHSSCDQHPNTSMFVRAGGVTPKKKATPSNALSNAITQLSSALSPKSASVSGGNTSASPAKVIDNRSKCYKQLSELKNIYSQVSCLNRNVALKGKQ